MRQQLQIFATLFFVFTLSACALFSPPANSPENLEKRVKTMMDAKIEGDWGVVYDHFCEGYRNKISRVKFINRPRISFEGYQIKTITLAQDKLSAEVEVDVTFSSRGFTFKDAKNNQHWLFQGNNWCQEVPANAFKEMMQSK